MDTVNVRSSAFAAGGVQMAKAGKEPQAVHHEGQLSNLLSGEHPQSLSYCFRKSSLCKP